MNARERPHLLNNGNGKRRATLHVKKEQVLARVAHDPLAILRQQLTHN